MTEDNICEIHDVNVSKLPGHGRGPLCVEEENIEAQLAHRVTRDPTVEPW